MTTAHLPWEMTADDDMDPLDLEQDRLDDELHARIDDGEFDVENYLPA